MPISRAVTATYDERLNDEAFDPSMALTWSYEKNRSLYLKYANATKAGGFNVSDRIVPDVSVYTFKPEEADSVELGYKAMLLGNAWQFNLALFKTEYDNLQVSSFNVDVGTFVSQNAASSTTQGLEIDSHYQISSNLQWQFGLSLLDAHYDDFDNARCNAEERLAGACTAQGAISRKGEDLVYAPEWEWLTAIEYHYALANELELSFYTQGLVSSGYEASTFYFSDSRQAQYEMINVSTALSSADEKWRLTLFANNITDEQVLQIRATANIYRGSNAGSYLRSDGASYGLQYTMSF